MELNLILWLSFIVVLLFFMFKKNGTKRHKKIVGGILIFIGVILLSPIPDPMDAIGFTIFSFLKGIKVSINNILTYFIEYTILSTILGIILIWAGLSISGLKLSYLKNKLKKIFRFN